MNMLALMALLMALLLPSVAAAAVDPRLVKNDPRLVKNATLRYLSGGVHPVLDGSTPGMVPKRGNATLGIEDGTIVVVDGVMHLFPTELSSGWTKTRVVHWTASVHDRLNCSPGTVASH